MAPVTADQYSVGPQAAATILESIPGNIPGELRVRAQWVVWKLEAPLGKPGKLTKVLYDARRPGRKAATDRAETWAMFAEAYACYQRGGYQGIGFVVTERDLVIAFDLDHCRVPETGTIETWAQAIVTQIATYWELSPSGTGLRGFALGVLPPGGRTKGQIERYDRGRFLTVTGHHLAGTPTTLEERPVELGELHAQIFGPQQPVTQHAMSVPTDGQQAPALHLPDLLDRMFAATNGDAIRRLWQGDWSGYPSPFGADLALCSYLRLWTGGNAAAMDVAFRESGLWRP